MAELTISGITGLVEDLEHLAANTPTLRTEILQAEADVIEPAVRNGVMDAGLVQTGKLRTSIGRTNTTLHGGRVIKIGPSGEHHRYFPSKGKSGIARAGHIGYIHEYGVPTRGMKARRWMSKAIEKSAGKAYDAGAAAYDQYMQKYNL